MVCNRFRRKRKKRPIHRRVHGVGKKKKKSGGKGFDGGGIRQEWKTDVAESSRYNYIRNVVASIMVIASFCCMHRWATVRRYAIKASDFHRRSNLIWSVVAPEVWRRTQAPTRGEWEEY